MSIATQVKRLQDVRNQIRAKMVSLGLSTKTDLLQDLANDLDGVAFRGNASTTLSTSTRSKTLDAGYYTGGTIKVPGDYFPVNSTNTTAAASDVLLGKKFVSTSGSTVTGTIATASSSDVSGDVKGDDPTKITLTAAKTSGSSSTTATAKAVVTKGLYTGSSNIEKALTSKTLTATAEATLANTNGAVSITAGTSDIVKTSTGDYSNGFITKVTVSPTPSEEKTATPSNTVQTVTPVPGKLLSKVTVNAIPSPYYNTSGVTATAGTVLKGYKFVNSSGATVTGTIATADSSNVSGFVSGSNPEKITLTTEKTSGSSSTTATASATVTKGLYTGSSNIKKDLTSQDFTATAEATLAASVSGSTKVPGTLPPGTVTITPSTDNTKRIYSDTTTNKGFITNVVLNAMASSSVSTGADPGTSYINKVTVTPTTESNQFVTITAGYLPNSKITVNAIPAYGFSIDTDAWSDIFPDETGSYTCTITGVTGVTADNDIAVYLSGSEVSSCGVYAYAQGDSSITFRAFNTPVTPIGCVVYILNN